LNLVVSEGKVVATRVKKRKQSLHTEPPGTLERLQPALSSCPIAAHAKFFVL